MSTYHFSEHGPTSAVRSDKCSTSFMIRCTEVGIYKKNKKRRKHAFVQEKKKEYTLSTKKAIKKNRKKRKKTRSRPRKQPKLSFFFSFIKSHQLSGSWLQFYAFRLQQIRLGGSCVGRIGQTRYVRLRGTFQKYCEIYSLVLGIGKQYFRNLVCYLFISSYV